MPPRGAADSLLSSEVALTAPRDPASSEVDLEIGTIGVCMRAIEAVDRSAHRRMLEFLWDKFVLHPTPAPIPGPPTEKP